MKFKFEGVDDEVVLPDEYLTFGQFNALSRYWAANNVTDEDLADANTIHGLSKVLLGEETMERIDSAPMSSVNFKVLRDLNEHLGELLGKAVEVGDEVVDGVEKKEQPQEVAAPPKKRGRPKKNK